MCRRNLFGIGCLFAFLVMGGCGDSADADPTDQAIDTDATVDEVAMADGDANFGPDVLDVGPEDIEKACTPGESTCLGQAVVTCIEDGSETVIDETCGDGTYCAESEGAASCTDQVCEPDLATCEGPVVKVCDVIGSGYVSEEDCGSTGHSCVDGACAPNCVDPTFVGANCDECADPTRAGSDCESVAFSSISTGLQHSCAVTVDGAVRCWGGNKEKQVSGIPHGAISGAVAGFEQSCALNELGEVLCWGANNVYSIMVTPDGSFVDVKLGDAHACALDTAGAVTCWGSNYNGQVEAQEQVFTQITAGGAFSGGLSPEGKLVLWGLAAGEVFGPEPYVQVAAGGSAYCTLDVAGMISCAHYTTSPIAFEPPAGTYTQVAVKHLRACGLGDAGTIICWGDLEGEPSLLSPPPGPFAQVAVGGNHICGLRLDGEVVCWGNNDHGQLHVPEPCVSNCGPGETNHEVLLANAGPAPATLTIDVGDSVTWTNDIGVDATLSASFLDKQLKPHESVAHLFTEPGFFAYEATPAVNPLGSITVQ